MPSNYDWLFKYLNSEAVTIWKFTVYAAVLHATQLQQSVVSTVLQPIQQRLLLSKFPGTNSFKYLKGAQLSKNIISALTTSLVYRLLAKSQ